MLHFELSEFDSPDEKGSGKYMYDPFLQMLDDARSIAGTSFKINSGFRTKSHNESCGGKIKSSHLFGYAADIHCNNSAEREKILNALIKTGFRRIGIANTFLHCDNDPDKNPAVWLY